MVTPCEFKVSYGTIRGLEHGAGNPRKILAVHGWLDNAASFTPIAPLIEDAHVVAVDLAGHGHSDHRPPGANYHLLDYAPDVVEVADCLNWSQFTLLGHSLGASVSSLIAATLPERVTSVCLIDGIGSSSGAEADCPARLKQSIRMRLQLPAKRRNVHRDIDSAVAARLRATEMDAASARLIVERNLVAVEQGYAWRTDRRLTFPSPLYLTESQVRAFLGAIESPALLVMADRGVIARRSTTPERIDCLDSIEVAEFGGGHHLHMDDAATVAAAINGFLAR